MTRTRSSWLAVLRFERRFRRRTERRVAGLRSLSSTVRVSAGIAGTFAFGLALGTFVVLAAIQQRQTPEQQIVTVAISHLVAIPEHEAVEQKLAEAGADGLTRSQDDSSASIRAPEAMDIRRSSESLAVPEDPAVRAAAVTASQRTAAEAQAETHAETHGETADNSGRLAAIPTDDASGSSATDTRRSIPDMPSVEQGPPATGEAARPPRQTRVAGLPIPPKPQWLRNAIRTPALDESPMIAVIMDDVGVNQRRTRQAVRLPGPLTIAVIPYGYNLKTHVAVARRSGHEIMVHIPMEPIDPGADPGPNALLTGLGPNEILRRLRWDLEQFDGYVGVSNHMGSRFTVWDEGMRLVMQEVRRRGLLFVDSWTHNRSLGMPMSRRFRVPNAARDIFIDHDITETAIRRRLGLLEKIARRRGYAVGIAHPHGLSMRLLEEWIGSVQTRGFRLVPISAIVRHRMKRR